MAYFAFAAGESPVHPGANAVDVFSVLTGMGFAVAPLLAKSRRREKSAPCKSNLCALIRLLGMKNRSACAGAVSERRQGPQMAPTDRNDFVCRVNRACDLRSLALRQASLPCGLFHHSGNLLRLAISQGGFACICFTCVRVYDGRAVSCLYGRRAHGCHKTPP